MKASFQTPYSILHLFWATWAAQIAARLQENKEPSGDWVEAVISPVTKKLLHVDRASIKMGLDWVQATTAADIARDFPTLTYDGKSAPRLPTSSELRAIFERCGTNLPVYAPQDAWLSSTRGIGGNGRGMRYDGSILTVNSSSTQEAEWRDGESGGRYALLLVRDAPCSYK